MQDNKMKTNEERIKELKEKIKEMERIRNIKENSKYFELDNKGSEQYNHNLSREFEGDLTDLNKFKGEQGAFE